MAKCYVTGDECTCHDFEDCPRDTTPWQPDTDIVEDVVSIREEFDQEYQSIQQELMFDNYPWGG